MQQNRQRQQQPKPRVDKMVIVYSRAQTKEPPREGDRRMIDGVMHVRRHVMVRPVPGDARAQLMNRGRPVFEWVTEEKYNRGYAD